MCHRVSSTYKDIKESLALPLFILVFLAGEDRRRPHEAGDFTAEKRLDGWARWEHRMQLWFTEIFMAAVSFPSLGETLEQDI